MPKGYIKPGTLRPEWDDDFVLLRRGPRRGEAIDTSHRAQMMAYAEAIGIRATYPEATVHWELTRRRLLDGVSFDFQSSLSGGRLELGGAVADFKFYDRPLIIRVMGEYWHQPWSAQGLGASDEEQRLYLESMGWTVLDFWESEILDAERREEWLRRNIDTPIMGWAP